MNADPQDRSEWLTDYERRKAAQWAERVAIVFPECGSKVRLPILGSNSAYTDLLVSALRERLPDCSVEVVPALGAPVLNMLYIEIRRPDADPPTIVKGHE